ncbi:restriction endonuclease subunit S [Vibrio cholerae]
MSKIESKTFVPELRFPEFLNEGSWKNKLLGECLLGKPEYGINAPAVPYSHELPTYLRITDILENGQISQDKKVSVERDVIAKNYLDVGDIVLARTGASVGKSYKYREKDGKLVFAGFLIRIKPDERKLNSEFLFQYLFTEQYWKWVSVNSARSGQPGINGNEYSLLSIPVPTQIEEQQKVADCLSSMDDLITTNIKKLESLELHKKGLMQKLFPDEGKSVPELRFDGFEDEWKVRSLDTDIDVIDGDRGVNYPKQQDFSKSGYCLFLNAKNVTKTGFKFDEVQFISKDKDEKLNKGKLTREDVVLTTRGSVGQFAYYSEEVLFEHLRINSGMVILRAKDFKTISPSYLYIFSGSEFLFKQISNMAFGNAQQQLTVSGIKKISLCFPKAEEQKKIVDCIFSINTLISRQTEKITTLKEYKRGLMQQLFPEMKESIA